MKAYKFNFICKATGEIRQIALDFNRKEGKSLKQVLAKIAYQNRKINMENARFGSDCMVYEVELDELGIDSLWVHEDIIYDASVSLNAYKEAIELVKKTY